MLSNLEKLELCGSDLTEVALRHGPAFADLCGNKLTALPAVKMLPKLRSLDLASNLLEFPPDVAEFEGSWKNFDWMKSIGESPSDLRRLGNPADLSIRGKSAS